jgi:hypothetical protein
MGLKKLATAKAVNASPSPQRSAYDPLAELAAGRWPGEAVFKHHRIDHKLALKTWLEGAAAGLATDWLYDVDDAHDRAYLRYGLHCYANGWSVIPETRESGKDRKPALLEWQSVGADRKPRKNSHQVRPSQQRDGLPPLWEATLIAERSLGYNVALIPGPSSSHVRAIDIDCLDTKLSEQLRDLAFEVFGQTPFVRIGQFPKRLLIYRVEGDDTAIPTFSKAFLATDGQPDVVDRKAQNAFEFLSAGHNFTIYGRHHRTKTTFDWSEGTLHPAIARPQAAPVIKKAQLNEFVTAAGRIRPFAGGGGVKTSSPVGGEATFTQFALEPGGGGVDFLMPKVAHGDWQRDPDGTISDGRESYLHKAAWAVAGANIGTIRASDRPRGLTSLTQYLHHAFYEHARGVINNYDGKYSSDRIAEMCRQKLSSALKKWNDSFTAYAETGSFHEHAVPRKILKDGRVPTAQHLPTPARPKDGALDWLPEEASAIAALSSTSKVKSVILADKTQAQIEVDRDLRALIPTLDGHRAQHDRVSAEISAAATEFLELITSSVGSDIPPFHILSAPTGAGKTVLTITAIGRFCLQHPRQPGEGPILVALPTHANIEEALAVAQRTGMVVPNPSELDELDAVAQLSAIGVRAAVLKGKTRIDPMTGTAMCRRVDEIRALRDAGIGALSLCSTRLDDEDPIIARSKRKKGEKVAKVEVLCPVRERGECEYWNQMKAIDEADIVFIPHNYLTMKKPPKAIAKARAVIVDESIVYKVLHQTHMPLSVLDLPRPLPNPTKAELGAGDREDVANIMLQNRDAVAHTAKAAFLGDVCPATAIKEAGQVDAVADAIKVCSRAHSAERDLSPLMTREQVLAMAAEHLQHGHLIEEEKLWRLIADRLDMLEAGTAKGDREERLQLVQMMGPVEGLIPTVRLSWRTQPNWCESPMLLLDASASPEIMGKVFGREATVHNVAAVAHVRTIALIERPYSNRAFMPPPDAVEAEVDLAAKTTKAAQALIDKVSSVYAHSRVLVGSTVSVRQHLVNDGWSRPQNVDAVHFGALRGRDGFKHHAAAISIGRSEQPIHVIDGFAAALTYDDDVPEKPYDRRGDGFIEVDGRLRPLFRTSIERTLVLRTGHDVSHFVPEMPGRWAKELEVQWREEELRQFVGRLRPVYRGAGQAAVDEPPVWICMSKSIPADVVVDEVLVLDDLVKDAPFWRLMQATGGIFSPAVIEANPSARTMLNGRTAEQFVDDTLEPNVTKKFISRLLAASSVVAYTIRNRDERAIVPAWHPDPVAALLEALPGVKITIRKATAPSRELDARAKAAAPDWVDLETADLSPAPVAAVAEEVEPDPLVAAILSVFPGAKIGITPAFSVASTAPKTAECSRLPSTLTPKNSTQRQLGLTGAFSAPPSRLVSMRRPARCVAIP